MNGSFESSSSPSPPCDDRRQVGLLLIREPTPRIRDLLFRTLSHCVKSPKILGYPRFAFRPSDGFDQHTCRSLISKDAIAQAQNFTANALRLALSFVGFFLAKVPSLVVLMINSAVSEFNLEHENDHSSDNTINRLRGGQSTTLQVPPNCTEEHLRGVKGVLIDLDGTLYNDLGLLPSTPDFHKFLTESSFPYVLLSNSGAKGAIGTQAKFSSGPFSLPAGKSIPLDKIFTGGMAAADFLLENAPLNARLFVLQSSCAYGEVQDSFLRILSRRVPEKLLSSWEIRTSLSDTVVREWARDIKEKGRRTFVVVASDGDISLDKGIMEVLPNLNHGKEEASAVANQGNSSFTYSSHELLIFDSLHVYDSFRYQILRNIVWLVTNGAHFLCHARDTHNPKLAKEPGFAQLDLTLPGPGTIEAFVASATYPHATQRLHNSGKGGLPALSVVNMKLNYWGNRGHVYMMQKGIQMLMDQGMDGKNQAVIIGDTLDTDIKGANDAGIRSILLRSGVHKDEDLIHYPSIRPTCILNDVGEVQQILASGSLQQ
eukprot:jgi/Bigna1/131799/aug1.15_g6507